MKLELIISLICLACYGGLLIYNQFYVREAHKAKEQIGITFPPFINRIMHLSTIFIGIAAVITVFYIVYNLFI